MVAVRNERGGEPARGVGEPARGGGGPAREGGWQATRREGVERIDNVAQRQQDRRARRSERQAYRQVHATSHRPITFLSGRGGRIGSISALVMGVFLAIFGASIFPVNPIAGLAFGGTGVVIAASAGTVYGVNYRV